MSCEYSHTKSESLTQIRSFMAEISIFSRGLFFIGAPCIWLYPIPFLNARATKVQSLPFFHKIGCHGNIP